MSQLDLLKEMDNFVYDNVRDRLVMKPAGNVEQSMGERAAEKADFWKDVEREMNCA